MSDVQMPNAIKRVVRNKKTNLYFVEETNAWVQSPEEATHYDSLSDVLGLCQKYHLADVELVMRFSEARYDVAVDICVGGGSKAA